MLLCYIPCTAGGICETVNLYLFNREGNLLKTTKRFAYDYADCGFNDYKKLIYQKDSLLLFEVTAKKMLCSEDSILSEDIKIESYVLSPELYLHKQGTQ